LSPLVTTLVTFCVTNIGHTVKSRDSIKYADVSSVKKLVNGFSDILISENQSSSTTIIQKDSDEYHPPSEPNSKISQF
jgi:hypothetical protein